MHLPQTSNCKQRQHNKQCNFSAFHQIPLSCTFACTPRDFQGTSTLTVAIANFQLSLGRCTTGPKPPTCRARHNFSKRWIKCTSLKPGANNQQQLCPVPTRDAHRINQLVTSYARSPPVTPIATCDTHSINQLDFQSR